MRLGKAVKILVSISEYGLHTYITEKEQEAIKVVLNELDKRIGEQKK